MGNVVNSGTYRTSLRDRPVKRVLVRAAAGNPQRGWLSFDHTTIPVALGRGGIKANKREGDGATPAAQEWNLEAADLLRLYETAVDAMPPKTRRVFLMHRVDELSYREIHELLGISIATVEYHMMKALGQISKVVDGGR